MQVEILMIRLRSIGFLIEAGDGDVDGDGDGGGHRGDGPMAMGFCTGIRIVDVQSTYSR